MSPWKALPKGHSKCTSRKRAGPGFVRSLVQRHWCRSLPRVRGNPSSFENPVQSTDQILEPFHQRWASLVADTTGLWHRWKVSSALICCFTVGSLFLSYFSRDGHLFFRRCRLKQTAVQIGFCRSRHVCFLDVVVSWTKHHKPDFFRDRPGRHGAAGFSFCKFFCDAVASAPLCNSN